MTHTGWRKPTPELLRAQEHAKVGEGISIPKSRAIAAIKRVAASIGLKAQDMLLLDTFGAFTKAQDWEQGRRPIIWASNNYLMDQTGFSLATLKRHIRRLAHAGVISFRDSANGKRYGRRNDDGYILEAYGFDLAPLAARTEEFEARYAKIVEERAFCASMRTKITATRRIIRAQIEKALESRLRGPWRDLQTEFSDMLDHLPKRNVASERLLDIVEMFSELKDRVEEAFAAAFDWPKQADNVTPEAVEAGTTDLRDDSIDNIIPISVNLNPSGVKNDPHILTTNQPHPVNGNSFEKKHATQTEPRTDRALDVDGLEDINLDIKWDNGAGKRGSVVDVPLLMIACPHFAEMARTLEGGFVRDWNDFHRAASKVRPMSGISEDAWNIANKVLGPQIAAATIALIFDKHSDGQVQSPGGYLRALVQRAQDGQLHLDRSFFGRLSETRAH